MDFSFLSLKQKSSSKNSITNITETPKILARQNHFIEKLHFFILQVSRLHFDFEENGIQEIKKKL